MSRPNGTDWGLGSPVCLIGAAGAALAAGARLLQERSGMEVKFMPLFDAVPDWVVSDITVLVAAVIGGAVAQIGCALVTWLKQEN
ncbi:MAG TPA: hypothetical protein VF342_13265 [Alphaproteobacteria bacterium]